MTAPDLLDTNAIARACCVKPGTIREWVRKGLLKPYGRTPGGHMRFHPHQVAEVLRWGDQPAPPVGLGRPCGPGEDDEAYVQRMRAWAEATKPKRRA